MDRAGILNSYFNKFEFLGNVAITEEVMEILLNLPEQYYNLVAAIESLLEFKEIPITHGIYYKIGEKLYDNQMDFWDPPPSISIITKNPHMISNNCAPITINMNISLE